MENETWHCACKEPKRGWLNCDCQREGEGKLDDAAGLIASCGGTVGSASKRMFPPRQSVPLPVSGAKDLSVSFSFPSSPSSLSPFPFFLPPPFSLLPTSLHTSFLPPPFLPCHPSYPPSFIPILENVLLKQFLSHATPPLPSLFPSPLLFFPPLLSSHLSPSFLFFFSLSLLSSLPPLSSPIGSSAPERTRS